MYSVLKATSSVAVASSAQSPASRHYRSVSTVNSEKPVCVEEMYELVSTKIAWESNNNAAAATRSSCWG